MKTWKKALSLMLALLMCLSLFPTAVFAADDAAPAEEITDTEQAEDPAEDVTDVPADPEDPAPAEPTDDPADPPAGDPADPVDPADPADPADPVDPAEPTAEPADPEDPADPADPAEPTDPAEPEDELDVQSEDGEEEEEELEIAVNGLVVDSDNFPDPQLLKVIQNKIDLDDDGVLTEEEINSVVKLDCAGARIQSLEGIEIFQNITELDCAQNQITELDLEPFKKLKKLVCYGTNIEDLDLNFSPLEEVYCYNNTNLKTIHTVASNSLRVLECTNCPELGDLYFYYASNLAYLKVRYCPKLTSITMWGCHKILYALQNGEENTLDNGDRIYSTPANSEVGAVWVELSSYQHIDFVELEGYQPDGSVLIDEDHFPDYNFRIQYVNNLDLNHDGSLSPEELANVTNITLWINKSVTDLTGIRYFQNLHILNLMENPVTNLPISNNTALTELHVGNVKTLGSLDVSNNTELQALYCSNCGLKKLDLSKNTMLRRLGCGGNSLSSLDLTKCTRLEELELYYMSTLKSLDLTKCTRLKTLTVGTTGITKLNLSNCRRLEVLTFEDCGLTKLDIGNVPSLKRLDCRQNKLTSLDVTQFPKLEILYCEDNQITTLNAGGLTKLQTLYANGNKLSQLNVTGCSALTYLSLYPAVSGSEHAAMTSLDLTGCISLEELHASSFSLSTLQLSDCTKLKKIRLQRNFLTSLDVSGFTDLTELLCDDNQLTSLNVSGCTALTTLNAGSNKDLTNLSIAGTPNLTDVNLNYAPLSSLDLSGRTKLKTFSLSSSSAVTSLNLSGCTALTKPNIPQSLVTLDVSGCTALTELMCRSGRLTSINLAGCTALKNCNLQNTYKLPELDISSCPCLVEVCRPENITSTPPETGDYNITYELPAKGYTLQVTNRTSIISIILVDENTFPDAIFRQYVMDNFDTDHDGKLSADELAAVTTINCSGRDIEDLKGIQYFRSLQNLNCSNNPLNELDLSKNTALITLNCSDTDLYALDLSKNTALTTLNCSGCSLEALDLSKNTSLASLNCFDNLITELDLRELPLLKAAVIGQTGAVVADYNVYFWVATIFYNANGGSGAPAPQPVPWRWAFGLSPVFPSRVGEWAFLGWSENPEAWDADWLPGAAYDPDYEDHTLYAVWSHAIPLAPEYFPDNSFRAVVSTFDTNHDDMLSEKECFSVVVLDCANRGIHTLKGIEYFEFLQELACHGNELTELDLSGNRRLQTLLCMDNYLTELDVSCCPSLRWLSCKNNPLSVLDVSNCPGLMLFRANASTDPEFGLETDLDESAIIMAPAAPVLDKSYVMLNPGRGTMLKILNLSDIWAEYIAWTIETGDLFNPGSDLATVSGDGLNAVVTASESDIGTVWVQVGYNIPGLESITTRCRVDVESGNDINGVQLIDNKVTVELFRTEYPVIEVIPLLEQNLAPMSPIDDAGTLIGGDTSLPPTGGIKSAEFVDPAAKAAFSLKVLDDRRLAVVPTAEALENPGSVAGKYSSAITVSFPAAEGSGNTLDTYQTDALTLTVKKSTPKLKASAVKFNSFIPDDCVPLSVTVTNGGTITGYEVPDEVNGKPVTIPDFVDINKLSDGILKLKDGSAKSGKLWLRCTVEGWGVPADIQISVSKAVTKPSLAVKPATLTLSPYSLDMVSAAVNITPAVFDNAAKYPVAVTKITEGSVTYEGDTLNDALITRYTPYDHTLRIILNQSSGIDYSKAHTYKLFLSISVGENEVSKAITVKTRKSVDRVSPVIVTAKAAGSIDTAVSMSPITITGTLKNYSAELSEDQWDVVIESNKELPSGLYTDDLFNFSDHYPFTITAKDEARGTIADLLAQKYSFSAILYAYAGVDVPTASKAVKLSIKASKTAPKVSVALKAAGSVDVIRPASAITLTPTIKNWYLYTPEAEDFKIYEKVGSNYEPLTSERFTVTPRDGSFVVTVKDGVTLNTKNKYFVRLETDIGRTDTTPGLMSGYTALKLTMGKVKLSNASVTADFLKSDRFSNLIIIPASADTGLGSVVNLTFADSNTELSKDGRFELVPQGDGSWMLQFAGNELPSNLKSATVKLNVFYDGNFANPDNPAYSGKPTANAVLTVKVNIK